MNVTPASVTALLHEHQAGDPAALGRLWEMLYPELRGLAGALVRGERPGQGPQPTELIHEAFIRLCRDEAFEQAPNRAFFFAAAARAMRQVLVDHARARRAAKRGGGAAAVPLDGLLDALQTRCGDVIGLSDALDALGGLDARQARVVELRVFGGHTMQEVADLLGVSLSTAEGDFRKARAFLHGRLVALEETHRP